jgi:hypothetical protein
MRTMAASGWAMKRSESDERLRQESPAYQPDHDWDEFEPQGMSVVMSVRFDARSARRIMSLARDVGRSPSELVRGWTLSRLEELAGAAPTNSPADIRETAAVYSADEHQYEVLRQRYRPKKIDVLLVGESRPAGGRFFYLANSHLFYATREAFERALGVMPPGEQFLAYLQERGTWLYDLVDRPVDRMRGRPRRSSVQARIGDLIALLREVQPRRVVVIKKDLAARVRQALDDADLSTDRLTVLPFPLYQWRRDYVEGLVRVVRVMTAESRPGRAAAVKQSPPSPTDRAVRGVTQRITATDISHGRIRIPARSKPLLPSAVRSMDIDLRGERMSVRYDPRNGPARARSGVFTIGHRTLKRVVDENEVLEFAMAGDEVVRFR